MTPEEILKEQGHRPWPLPTEPWRWWQSWQRLLFAHWPVEAAAIEHLIPPQLELQTFDGVAWIGVVPFELSIRPRYTPLLPWGSVFPEINVRTYVRFKELEGVFFLSLDASQPVACWAARKSFHLPYHWARMSMLDEEGGVHFTSSRRTGTADFVGSYRPGARIPYTKAGTFDHWLTERYALFSRAPSGDLFGADVHHAQWPLREAEADIDLNTMMQPTGVVLPDSEPVLHYAHRIDVLGWPLRHLAAAP